MAFLAPLLAQVEMRLAMILQEVALWTMRAVLLVLALLYILVLERLFLAQPRHKDTAEFGLRSRMHTELQ